MPRPRAFDHDEAIRLRAGGMTYAAIATRLGVSAQSVNRACMPEYRERQNRLSIDRLRALRQPCAGGCGRVVWAYGLTGMCRACLGIRSRTAEHGTETRYNRGCPCDECRTAATTARRERRQRQQVAA